MNTTSHSTHVGRNISCIRLLRVLKQETLAATMGVKLQVVIQIEKSREVQEVQLLKVAKALEVSVDGIRNFSEDAVIDYISKFTDKAIGNDTVAVINSDNDTTLEELIAAYQDNKNLYERLLNSEKEKVKYLKSYWKTVVEKH